MCGTCWLSAGSLSGYWGVDPTTQSLEKTLWTPTFHRAEGINSDVQSVNIGIHSAWRKASDCTLWSSKWQHSIKVHATEEREKKMARKATMCHNGHASQTVRRQWPKKQRSEPCLHSSIRHGILYVSSPYPFWSTEQSLPDTQPDADNNSHRSHSKSNPVACLNQWKTWSWLHTVIEQLTSQRLNRTQGWKLTSSSSRGLTNDSVKSGIPLSLIRQSI